MPIYSPEGVYVSYAIGTDLTAWRNGDLALVATECQATDLIDGNQNVAVDYTDPETEEIGLMSASQYKTRYTTGYRPGRIVIPTYLQTGVGMYSTLGTCVTTRTGKETTTVVCVAGSEMVDGSYFLINCVNAAGATVKNYVWFNAGGDADPTPAGYTEIQVDYAGGDTAAQVATKMKDVMDAADFYDATVVTDTVTVVTANNGAVEDATDVDTTLAITVTVQGASTHTITLATSQTPISTAYHLEKEMTGQDVRYDFLGHMPDYWRIYCGEDRGRWKARQELAANFAYTRASAGNLAEPTKLPMEIYEWSDLKHASGIYTIKYNATDLEFDKRSLDVTTIRTRPLWGVKGASGFPTGAFISGVGIEFLVEGYLKGDNVRTLMATKPEDYAGTGLDVVIKFYKAANREYGVTLSNLYLVPDQTILNEVDWYEKKTLRFVSNASTVAGASKDAQDKTYYEND